MNAKPRLQIQQSELRVEVQFLRPAVRLLEVDSGIVRLLLENLSDFGAGLEGFRIDLDYSNLGQSSLTCPLLGGFGSLTLTGTGFVLHLRGGPTPEYPDVPRLVGGGDQLAQILDRISTAIASVEERADLRTCSFSFSFHAKVDGATQAEIMGEYVSLPAAPFGEVSSVAVRFSFQPEGEDLGSWLLFEPSNSIQPDGLFVAATVDFDGTRISASEAAGRLLPRVESLLQHPDFPVVIQ